VVVIIAKLKALPGKEEALAGVCLDLAREVRQKEKECLMYIPHVSVGNPGEVVFIEKYASREALDYHRQTSHFKEASILLKDILDGPPEVTALKELG